MVHYTDERLLQELCDVDSSSNLASQLVEVLAIVLDNEEDEEGHLTVLQVMEDLMSKHQDYFLDHFARLGIFNKVLALSQPPDLDDQPPPPKTKEEKVSSLHTYTTAFYQCPGWPLFITLHNVTKFWLEIIP